MSQKHGPWPNTALGPTPAPPQEPGPSSGPLPRSPPQFRDWAGLFRPEGGQLARSAHGPLHGPRPESLWPRCSPYLPVQIGRGRNALRQARCPAH